MDILDTLRQAPSAELYRLYLAIGKMLDDPKRILEVRQRLYLGMSVDYVGDNPLEPLSQGTVVVLRHTQAVVQDSRSRRHWAIPYAAIVPAGLPQLFTLSRHRRRAQNAKSSSSATRSGSLTST